MRDRYNPRLWMTDMYHPSFLRIRNYYWHIRSARPFEQAKRRRYYRYVEKEKRLLLAAGVDPEFLRLYCRQFASLDPAAGKRFRQYAEQFTNLYKTSDHHICFPTI